MVPPLNEPLSRVGIVGSPSGPPGGPACRGGGGQRRSVADRPLGTASPTARPRRQLPAAGDRLLPRRVRSGARSDDPAVSAAVSFGCPEERARADALSAPSRTCAPRRSLGLRRGVARRDARGARWACPASACRSADLRRSSPGPRPERMWHRDPEHVASVAGGKAPTNAEPGVRAGGRTAPRLEARSARSELEHPEVGGRAETVVGGAQAALDAVVVAAIRPRVTS